MQKVIQANIQRFKCLQDFEVKPEGQSFLLVGDNELGKTSIQQFLQIALGNIKLTPPNAEGMGSVTYEKNGVTYIFNLEFKEGKPVVTVTGPDGMRDKRRGTLAAIVGAMDFDIEEFVNLSKTEAGRKKQIEIVKSFLPQETLDELLRLEAHVNANYSEREELGRQIKTLKGSIDSHSLRHETDEQLAKYSFVDTKVLMDELNIKEATNKSRQGVTDRQTQRTQRIKELEEQIKQLTEQVGQLVTQQVDADKWLEANPHHDTETLKLQLAQAGEANAKHAEVQRLRADRQKLSKWEAEYGEYGVKIDTGREAIREAIRDLGGPIDGLGFDSERLIWNGCPVHPESMSESQTMELGLRLRIAQNPEAPLFLERTESYGKKRWETILELAASHGLQIIGERVLSGQEELKIEYLPAENKS